MLSPQMFEEIDIHLLNLNFMQYIHTSISRPYKYAYFMSKNKCH